MVRLLLGDRRIVEVIVVKYRSGDGRDGVGF